MSDHGFRREISGAEKFQLVLDRHIRLKQATGNANRLTIEVKGKIDAAVLKEAIAANTFLTEINSLSIEDSLLKIPEWRQGKEKNPVEVTTHSVDRDNYIPDEVLLKDIKVNSGKLILVDLVNGVNNSTVVIAVHQALADNSAMQSIARIIAGTATGELASAFAPENEKTSFTGRIIETIKAGLFVLKTSPRRMSLLRAETADTKFKVIRFTPAETATIDKIASERGAAASNRAFYLTVTAMVLSRFIFRLTSLNFFVRVPLDLRAKNNNNLWLGNRLSYLFFKIPFIRLESFTGATTFITEKLTEQENSGLPGSYSQLLKTFRRLPFPVYDSLFRVPAKGVVSSFFYSYIYEPLPEMKTFFGKEIAEVLSFAPNPSPPHITFVYLRHNDALKIAISYNSSIIPYEQIDRFERSLRLLLKR